MGIASLIPLNLLSRVTGRLARWQPPGSIKRLACQSFVKAFGIDMSESAISLEECQSIEDVFTRPLKPGMRNVAGRLCSPADGVLSQMGVAEQGQAVQAKGQLYSLSELVFGTQNHTDLYSYFTVYLAPHNYHRVHSPSEAHLLRMRYFPGQLWPVNKPSVRWTPKLFVRNERLVFDFYDVKSKGRIHVVMVGALNVGRMTSPFWENFATNDTKAQRRTQEKSWQEPVEVGIGQEIGTFMLGSTVVVVLDEKAGSFYKLKAAQSPLPIAMGEKIR